MTRMRGNDFIGSPTLFSSAGWKYTLVRGERGTGQQGGEGVSQGITTDGQSYNCTKNHRTNIIREKKTKKGTVQCRRLQHLRTAKGANRKHWPRTSDRQTMACEKRQESLKSTPYDAIDTRAASEEFKHK